MHTGTSLVGRKSSWIYYIIEICANNWSFRTKCLSEEIGLIDNFMNKAPVDLEMAEIALIDKLNSSWKEEATTNLSYSLILSLQRLHMLKIMFYTVNTLYVY